MSIEMLLLALESVLLAATIVLLVLSIREGRSRNELLLEIGKAVKVLTRHEYFITVIDSMMDAESEIIGCITGRMTQGEDKKRIDEVMFNIERLSKKGVKVRYLLPKFQDRLHVGWLYARAGAEVRFSSFHLVQDFRYIVVDGRTAVIGIPESTGEKEATKKGYKIPSAGLAAILKENFNQCWEDNIGFAEYAKETLKQTGMTPKMLAGELKIDEDAFMRFIGE